MLFPLTIAIIIVLAIVGLLYRFRVPLARFLGLVGKQVKQDEMEVRREYEDGRGNRG